MKSLRLLVIFMSLASSALAGWNANAWPSTNGVFRFANSTDLVLITNYYALRHQVTVSVTNKTIDGAGTDEITGFNTGGWTYALPGNSYQTTNAWATNFAATSLWQESGMRLTVAQSANSNFFVLTNQLDYFTDLQYGNTLTAETNIIANPATNVVTNVYRVIFAAYTNEIIEEVSDVVTGALVSSAFAMSRANVKDVRSLDGYKSVRERFLAITYYIGEGRHFNTDITFPPFTNDMAKVKFFRNERDNLVELKFWLRSMTVQGHFADRSTSVDGDFNGYFSNETNQNWQRLYLTNLVANVNLSANGAFIMPTNYFNYTPYRDLDGIGSDITNEFTSTNDNSARGGPFTVLDYGWLPFTNIIGEMLYSAENITNFVANDIFTVPNVFPTYPAGQAVCANDTSPNSSTSSYADAVAGVVWPNAFANDVYLDPNPIGSWFAAKGSWSVRAGVYQAAWNTRMATDSVAFAYDMYGRITAETNAFVFTPPRSPGGVRVFDSQGDPRVKDYPQIWKMGTTTNSGPTDDFGWGGGVFSNIFLVPFGPINFATVPTAPATDPDVGGDRTRGWWLGSTYQSTATNAGHIGGVIRWDVDGGFEYK